jgi:hypothetical protein
MLRGRVTVALVFGVTVATVVLSCSQSDDPAVQASENRIDKAQELARGQHDQTRRLSAGYSTLWEVNHAERYAAHHAVRRLRD